MPQTSGREEEGGGRDCLVQPQLKPHERERIQFMFGASVESVEEVKNPGGGAILAHGMGLGKTLPVITLTHTRYTNKPLNCNRFPLRAAKGEYSRIADSGS